MKRLFISMLVVMMFAACSDFPHFEDNSNQNKEEQENSNGSNNENNDDENSNGSNNDNNDGENNNDDDTTISQSNNCIHYTSSDNHIIELRDQSVFDANIISNTCENFQGVIRFDREVTKIGAYAFKDCNRLTRISIPESITEIGYEAFIDCIQLKKVDITNLEAWMQIDFNNKYANPLIYAQNLYLNGKLVESVIVPKSITELKNYVFFNASCLQSITMHDNISSIGEGALYGCMFTELTIPDSVTQIKDCAIQNCDAMVKISLGNGITKMGNNVCSGNDSLENVVIPGSLMETGDWTFSACSALTNVHISSGVVAIGRGAFEYCPALKSVNIPNSVTSIGESAFSSCSALESITIPNGVTSIGGYAFESCDALTSVNIPNSVTSIGECAFYNCKALKEVYCKPTTPPTGGNHMFSDYQYGYKPIGCTINVPAVAINAYKQAEYWSYYISYIKPYNFME